MTYRRVKWVVFEKASECTGRSIHFFRHLIREGHLIEGKHRKWSDDNRQHINLEAYDEWVSESTSKVSSRGRRRSESTADGMTAASANA